MTPVNNKHFIDRCPKQFEHFLNYLRSGVLFPFPIPQLIALKTEAQFFECESLVCEINRKKKKKKKKNLF